MEDTQSQVKNVAGSGEAPSPTAARSVELVSIEGPGPLAEISQPKPLRVIDWTRPVQTVSGRVVHIYAIDHRLKQPVVGRSGNDTSICQWDYDGAFMSNGEASGLDLENALAPSSTEARK